MGFCKEDLSGFKRLGAGLINRISLEEIYDRTDIERLRGTVLRMYSDPFIFRPVH